MDYAQARLQSRFGERPSEALWQRLEAATVPAAALALAESCALRRWVLGLAPDADTHSIEIALRMRWRECVAETASWMPQRWQAALLWSGALVDLPALGHLAGGGAPLHWMLRDPVLQAYARADPQTRAALLQENCSAFARAQTAQPERSNDGHEPAQLRRAWLEEWRGRWPRWGDTTSLEDLAKLLQTAMQQPALEARNALRDTLQRLFRRSLLRPAAAFVYLACVALDLERLRAGLLKHSIAREGIIAS